MVMCMFVCVLKMLLSIVAGYFNPVVQSRADCAVGTIENVQPVSGFKASP